MRSNANTMLKWRHLGLFQFLGLCHCWEKSQSHGACVHLSVCTRRRAALARRLRFPVRVWDLHEMQAGMGLSYSQVLWCKRECLNALTNKAAGFKKQKNKTWQRLACPASDRQTQRELSTVTDGKIVTKYFVLHWVIFALLFSLSTSWFLSRTFASLQFHFNLCALVPSTT